MYQKTTYICNVIKNKENMRYLHYVLDQDGKQIETNYSTRNAPKFSMECLAKIKNGVYKIWDRETNETTTIL